MLITRCWVAALAAVLGSSSVFPCAAALTVAKHMDPRAQISPTGTSWTESATKIDDAKGKVNVPARIPQNEAVLALRHLSEDEKLHMELGNDFLPHGLSHAGQIQTLHDDDHRAGTSPSIEIEQRPPLEGTAGSVENRLTQVEKDLEAQKELLRIQCLDIQQAKLNMSQLSEQLGQTKGDIRGITSNVTRLQDKVNEHQKWLEAIQAKIAASGRNQPYYHLTAVTLVPAAVLLIL